MKFLKKYWWTLLVAAIALLIPFAIERYIATCVINGYEDTWTASIGSYWGGIIGGVVSGLLACVGVFVTIRYYKDSDARKERAAIMPFFKAWEEDYDLGEDYTYLPRDIKRQQSGIDNFTFAIQNIGNGFAYVDDVRCRTDKEGSHVGITITKDQGIHLYLLIKERNNLDETVDIHFLDAQGNRYIQSLRICDMDNRRKILSEYPMLIQDSPKEKKASDLSRGRGNIGKSSKQEDENK